MQKSDTTVINTKELQKRRVRAQNDIMSFGIEVFFNNIFYKPNRDQRKEPDRHLICYIETEIDREILFNSMSEKGYTCEQTGISRSKNYNGWWMLRIDLFA